MATTIIFISLGIIGLVCLGILAKKIFELRRVVPPSEVHIVRKSNKTLLYGALSSRMGMTEETDGNCYYAWPEWIPVIGVKINILPLSVFDIKLDDYRCNDKDKLPFSVDIQAFFRIHSYKTAAARIKNAAELNKQLRGVLEGIARHLLGSNALEDIMVSYAGYGQEFTTLVNEALTSWGLATAKTIEIMDVRDVAGETIIKQITSRKKSEVEKESRIAIANNNQKARQAEIDAAKAIELAEQEKTEIVGKRKAEVSAKVSVENEKAAQQKHDAAKTTKEKEMAVLEVEKTRQADIDKRAQIIKAEAEREKLTIESSGQLKAKKNEAEAIKVTGEAEADAQERYLMASVSAQTALAQEIGENDGYQDYLVKTRQIDAAKIVGLKQAENLGKADIRIIAGAGDVSTGVGKAAGVFSPKGGFGFAGMLEALGATDQGKSFLDSINAFLNRSGKNAKSNSAADILEALNSSEEGKELLESVTSFLSKSSQGGAPVPPSGK